MTTLPPTPTPTLAIYAAYLLKRAERAESYPTGWCSWDITAVKALAAEVERLRIKPE